MTTLTNYEKAIIWKECEQLFFIQHKNTSKSNAVQLGCELSGQNPLISQIFFVQINPYKDVLFKVATGEIESLSTIKHFNKRENK